MRGRPALIVTSVTAASVLMASCGSPAGSDGSASSVRGVTPTEITVEGLATLTSVTGATLPGSDIGARAVFSKVNASGGIAGRRIDFLGTKDDGGEPSSDLAAARDIVQRDDAFAVVPAVTSTLGGASFLQSGSVPAVGYMSDPAACSKTYLFDITGCSAPPQGDRVYSPAPGLVLAEGAFHNGADGTSVAVTVDDDSSGRASAEACSGPFRTAGFRVVLSSLPVPAGVGADLGPAVHQIMTSDGGRPPDAVWACDNFDTVVGLTAALRSAGYAGLVYSPVTYDLRIPQIPALRQTLQGSDSYTTLAPSEADTTAVQQARRQISAVDPGAQLSLPVLASYFSAEMFVQILRKVGRRLTPQRFAQAANSGFTFSADGGTCPVSFPAGHTEGSVGGGLVQLQGSQYQVLLPLLCRPMTDNVRY